MEKEPINWEQRKQENLHSIEWTATKFLETGMGLKRNTLEKFGTLMSKGGRGINFYFTDNKSGKIYDLRVDSDGHYGVLKPNFLSYKRQK